MRASPQFVVATLLALLTSGCTCCSSDPPYSTALVGSDVEFEEFSAPVCTYSSCDLKLDVVNSNREVVRTLYRGDPDLAPEPVIWDTRDDDGTLVPADVYTLRAWMNDRRIDAWVVLLYDYED